MGNVDRYLSDTKSALQQLVTARLLLAMLLSGLLYGACANADHLGVQEQAQLRNQAKRIHDRLAGVPPDAATLDAMVSDLHDGDPQAAAMTAMDNPNFYNVTLKNWATPWTNRDQTVFAPLNDYSATVIGMVRDGKAFNTLLSTNVVYHANSASNEAGQTAPDYSRNNNNHYEWLEDNGIDLSSALIEGSQTTLLGIPDKATAGVMTTRAAAAAFFVAGTNRAMFRFTLLNHMCSDLEQVKDTTRSPDRVRQDVSRSPGGDSRIYLNNCVGCHAGMDPWRKHSLTTNSMKHPERWNTQTMSCRRSISTMLKPSAPASSHPMTAGTTIGVKDKTHYWDGTQVAPHPAGAPRPWDKNWQTVMHSLVARLPKPSKRSACATRLTAMIAMRSKELPRHSKAAGTR